MPSRVTIASGGFPSFAPTPHAGGGNTFSAFPTSAPAPVSVGGGGSGRAGGPTPTPIFGGGGGGTHGGGAPGAAPAPTRNVGGGGGGGNSGPRLLVAPSVPRSGGGGSGQRGNPDANSNPNGPANVSAQADVDFGPYMADLQRRIKRAWFPPKGNESKRVVVLFKVHKQGELSNLRLQPIL